MERCFLVSPFFSFFLFRVKQSRLLADVSYFRGNRRRLHASWIYLAVVRFVSFPLSGSEANTYLTAFQMLIMWALREQISSNHHFHKKQKCL